MSYFRDDEGHLGGYLKGQAAPGTWAPKVWEWLVREQGVRSMASVGCGLGYDIEFFAGLGCSVTGIDGSPSAIRDNRLPESVIEHDYTKGPLYLPVPVDLVWSAEFVEHVEERNMDNFLATFAQARRFVVMTFAVPGQGGYHHVNEQPQSYWESHLSRMGFVLDSTLTAHARRLVPSEGHEGSHFRKKGLVFIRQS